MSLSLIKQALVQSYVDGSFGLSTAYENRTFEPTKGTPWASVMVERVDGSAVTLGDSGEDNHAGYMQIDLNYPTNEGDGDILAKLEALRAYYTPGTSFTSSGQSVIIRYCEPSGGRLVDGWYRISLTVYYYARIART